MTLTLGTGPFGPTPAGRFNVELPRSRGIIYFEDFARHIRARFAGHTVVERLEIEGAITSPGE